MGRTCMIGSLVGAKSVPPRLGPAPCAVCIARREPNVTVELLDRQWPKPGEEDLRDFEWRYLWKLCQSDERATFPAGAPPSIAFSPDEKYLYITQAMRKLVRFDVQPDGTITNGHIFFDLDFDKRPGGPDGMKTDKDGNLTQIGFIPDFEWSHTGDTYLQLFGGNFYSMDKTITETVRVR